MAKTKPYLVFTTEMIFLLGGYKHLVDLEFVRQYYSLVNFIVAVCVIIMLATVVFSSATSKQIKYWLTIVSIRLNSPVDLI
jgi:hypothetical protein